MTIKEAEDLLRKLEEDIAEAINEYEKRTGCIIESVDITRTIGIQTDFVFVECRSLVGRK